MQHINPKKVGIILGMFIGGIHVIWSILVALGWAQPLINFISLAHMIQPFVTVTGFNLTSAITLIISTSLVGFVIGYILGVIWNKTHHSF